MSKPTIAVSACLLGQSVRYDGLHKRERWITDKLSAVALLEPVCPEIELGLGTPRAPIRLERSGTGIALRSIASGADLTGAMSAHAAQRLAALTPTLSGYILKSRSPSCGLEGVKVFSSETEYTDDGSGLFAAELIRRAPGLPVIEEVGLARETTRDDFLTRVFTLYRLRELTEKSVSLSALSAFHQRHKLLLLAYSPAQYQRLNELLAAGASGPVTWERYREHFMGAFTSEASTERHASALRHAASYFHGALSGAGRFAIQQVIDDFQAGRVSRQLPLQIISAEAQRCQLSYLTQQYYLEPFPRQLLA